jgi:hypothetical protein
LTYQEVEQTLLSVTCLFDDHSGLQFVLEVSPHVTLPVVT